MLNTFFQNNAKTIRVLEDNNIEVYSLYEAMKHQDSAEEKLNIFTLVAIDFEPNFLVVPLEAWIEIRKNLILPEYVDLCAVLNIHWHTQPVLVISDRFEMASIEDELLIAVRNLNIKYSRDIAAEDSSPDEEYYRHYMNQDFDLDTLAKMGIYLNGMCYSIKDRKVSPLLPAETAYIVPVTTIYNNKDEIQQVLAFDQNGTFIKFVSNKELIG